MKLRKWALLFLVLGGLIFLGARWYYMANDRSPLKDDNHSPVKIEDKLRTFNRIETKQKNMENKNADKATYSAKNVIVNIIVADAKDKEIISQEVKKLGGEVLKGEKEKGVILRAKIPEAALKKLAAFSQVIRIEPYVAPQFLNDRAAGITGAESLAASGFVSFAGLTGANQVVGLADSGLGKGRWESLPEDLQSVPGQKPKVIMLKSWAGRTLPDDPVGHGTHMAATIAGTGAASQGKFAGLAPNASIYFQGILNKKGEIDPPADVTALYIPAFEANTYLYVNGWGTQSNAYLSNAVQTDAFMRRHPDFLVIFGAGNKGPAAGTITTEANSKNALVIGASENVRPAFGLDSDNAGELAYFSSRGPTADGRLKPDLVAPGAEIVSACSPLKSSNFSASSQYTRMSGTSMAAAIGGGAAALLREYLQKEENIALPTAALLKALLINGATPLKTGEQRLEEESSNFPTAQNQPPTFGKAGFGRLDLASTVLALKEKTFHYTEEKDGLVEGETKTYTFELKDNNIYPALKRPFKATLAWTDPAGTPGNKKILVNDLDLVVETPDGKKYLGNDAGQGKRDEKNNVEQVFISTPISGTHKITVKAGRVTQKGYSGAYLKQDFALVFGQTMIKDTIKEIDPVAQKVKLAGGETLFLPQDGKNALGKNLVPWENKYILPGEEVFWGGKGLYLQGKVWRIRAAEKIVLLQGNLFLEASSKDWEGGYYLALGAHDPLWVNGEQIREVNSFPTGTEIFASVNPPTQTLWLVKATFEEVEGFIQEVNLAKNQLFLINQEKPYVLTPETAISFANTGQGGSPADLPFGLPASGEIKQLVPGMAVKLMLSSANKEVNYVAVKRNLAVGTVVALDEEHGEITLDDNQKYTLFPHLPVWLNNQAASLADLKSGVLAGLVLSGRQVITITAYHKAMYGQIVYFNQEHGSLYLIDDQNQFHLLKILPETKIYRWGRLVMFSSLRSGDWVRLISQNNKSQTSNEKIVLRIDVAEVERFSRGELISYDEKTKEMFFLIPEDKPNEFVSFKNDASNYAAQDHTSYAKGLVTARTLITKNGYPVQAEDLLATEELELTLLKVPGQQLKALARVKANSKKEINPPLLQVTARSWGQNIRISGYTNASKIYLYVPEEIKTTVIPDSRGQFLITREYPAMETIQIVAVQSQGGGVIGKYLHLPPSGVFFTDLKNHWAEKEINILAEKGLLNGYADGNFLPNQPVSRAEFTVMIMRSLPDLTFSALVHAPFVDSLPLWAEKEINNAWQAKIISGYPDGHFYPEQLITRAEAAVILAYTQDGYITNQKVENLSYPDKNKIPSWAAAQVCFTTQIGLLHGFPDGHFVPLAHLTRAQAAVIVFRLASLGVT